MKTHASRAFSQLLALVAGCATEPTYVPKDAPPSVAAGAGESRRFLGIPREGRLHRFRPRAAPLRSEPRRRRTASSSTSRSDGQRVDSLVYAPGWNGLEHPLHEPPALPLRAGFPGLRLSARAGQELVHRGQRDRSGRPAQTYRVHTRGKVVGWERIKVPAGEFDALKIQR